MELLASCRLVSFCLTTEPWPLGAPRLPFAASFQSVGQNERLQGALKLGKLSTSFPSFSLQCSEQVGRDEGSPSRVPVTAGMTSLSQGTRDTHPQQPRHVLWRHCIWQLWKGKTARFVKVCSLVNFLYNSCRKELGRVTYEVDDIPAYYSRLFQDLICVPVLTLSALPSLQLH